MILLGGVYNQMNAQNMYPNGLAYCSFAAGQSQGVLSYCGLKAAELTISGLFALACAYELYKQVKTYSCRIQWRFFALGFMIMSLLINMAFCLWNNLYQLYSLESYFFSLYYLAIVGYVCRLYMRKNGLDSPKCNVYIFGAVLLAMGLLSTSILIDALVTQDSQAMVNHSCEEVWYLVVNLLCLLLCVLALAVLYVNYREETNRMLFLSFSQSQLHNPLKDLWCWMGINTLAQVVDLVETGLLIGTNKQTKCLIIKDNELANNVLTFMFGIVTLTAGYAATLYYFAQVRRATGYVQQLELTESLEGSGMRGSYGVQLFNAALQDFVA